MQIFTFRERFNAPRGTTFVVRMNRNMKARTYLRGHSLLQFEVALEEEVPPVGLVAARHGRGEVEAAVALHQSVQVLVLGLLKMAGTGRAQSYCTGSVINFRMEGKLRTAASVL